MFAKITTACFVAVLALVSIVSAAPAAIDSSDLVTRGGFKSFNNWGGFHSLNGFDNFYGVDNFDNSHFSPKSITIVKEKQLVCRAQSIEIIQQRLLIIQEMAKRIITEQVCEVETQTIVFQQFYASLHGFSRDLRRFSGRQVGYDAGIANHFGSIISSDGSLTSNNFGFSGHDLGKSYVIPAGNNWDNVRSFGSVGSAYRAARSAIVSF
ncbi:hypothetical protein NLJ89_g186 [Agrocybe chaxingu]|uniref:Uncharacterized protein n=1 Tax=Agrocybe chaxingu TaxID=84603 RepID=A0A9W8N2C2_9AGAR|nr:hypothetical protein NLJ89_g186 [Agrocybe chaxingu]